MTYDICGIGNACMDIVDTIDDAFLERWGFPKSICSYLTFDQSNALLADLPNPQYIAGGCAANTASTVCALGGNASFIGRIAHDEIGDMFIEDMDKRGIRFLSIPDESHDAGSTRVFCLTTPDTERTFASYYGVQEDLSEDDITDDGVADSKYLYIDGYALNSRRGGEAFLKAAAICKAAGNRVLFAPNDLSIMTKYGDAVAKILPQTDLLLCNEQEARHITGMDDMSLILKNLQSRFAVGAVTIGKDGVFVYDKNTIYQIPAATPPAPVIDTNGAGDAFAGGFVFGLTHGYDLPRAAKLGNLCASVIITHTGARPQSDYRPFLEQL